ncbi:MAG: LD-carboxypeptidase [Fusobacteriaceae bacterium]
MIKPKRLKRGDKIAIVSLSWGGLGDSDFIHKFYIAKERLEKDFGLKVLCMPHALKGSKFIAENPKLRAQDLMNTFLDETISGIFCAIGGDDTIRILPYIDFNIIKNNPKIFMGYSDTTVNHLMMYKAGHASPNGILPYGINIELDCDKKRIIILENSTIE